MNRRIPIFFAADDNYLPYLAVTVKSISDHATPGNIYDVRILTNGFSDENLAKLLEMELNSVEISVININEVISKHREDLIIRLRDYYSESIYYRIFISSMFPELERAIYIDCDIVLVDDIAKLYDTDIGDNILGAVSDESIPGVPEFCIYVEKWVGVPVREYINSGVLLMNLKQFREERVEERFTELLYKYNFDTVAPDQDYLNFLCNGRIHYLDLSWNKQPKPDNIIPSSELHLIHYNMFNKPWHYAGVPYSDEFWSVADSTPFANRIREGFESYTDEKRQAEMQGGANLIANADRLSKEKGGFRDTVCAVTL